MCTTHTLTRHTPIRPTTQEGPFAVVLHSSADCSLVGSRRRVSKCAACVRLGMALWRGRQGQWGTLACTLHACIH